MAKVFGQRERVFDASISPSRKQLAIVGPAGSSGEALYVIDLSTGAKMRQILIAATMRANTYFGATVDR